MSVFLVYFLSKLTILFLFIRATEGNHPPLEANKNLLQLKQIAVLDARVDFIKRQAYNRKKQCSVFACTHRVLHFLSRTPECSRLGFRLLIYVLGLTFASERDLGEDLI